MIREIMENINEASPNKKLAYEYTIGAFIESDVDGQKMERYSYKSMNNEYSFVIDWFKKNNKYYTFIIASEEYWIDKILLKVGAETSDKKIFKLKPVTNYDDVDYKVNNGSEGYDTGDFYSWVKSKSK